LREKFGDKCCLCGWSKVNQKTGKVPLVADHIDGNWRNNSESNLRLICPNCDALLPTFSALNKGRGRNNRIYDNRAKEAGEFVKNFSQ
ncbi:MAG: HNH endonuclease, partial [Patescibacteria group bacterium]